MNFIEKVGLTSFISATVKYNMPSGVEGSLLGYWPRGWFFLIAIISFLMFLWGHKITWFDSKEGAGA